MVALDGSKLNKLEAVNAKVVPLLRKELKKVNIDKLTPAQKKYLVSWELGT